VRSCLVVPAASVPVAPAAATAPTGDERSARAWLVIAGGGTIGHLTPGLAAAEEFARRGLPKASIWFVGSERGVEATRLPGTGWPHTLLPGRGIQRRFTVANLGAVWGLVSAFVQSLRLLRRLRPAVVLATGGYASVACSVAAAICRVPVVVAEQNAVPGLANRMAGRWAKAAATSFPGTALPRASVTGNPVRPEMAAVDRRRDCAAAREALGVTADRTLVVIFGGSLGARRLNDAGVALRQRWRDRDDLAVRHIVGDRDWDRYAPSVAPVARERLAYQPVRFEDRMPEVFAAADVVLCRAGASTCAELTVVGLPAVLVPLPNAPGDHQTANATVLADHGGAVLVSDAEATADRLGDVLDDLAADPARRAAMATALLAIARPDAATAVADLVEAHASRPSGARSSRSAEPDAVQPLEPDPPPGADHPGKDRR
jgi:undecaprenyldiphospho-muramoylpentapeptide beta-N-acetylglucosaminyltransferase